MYELTKQKSKGRIIIFGIIVFAFITAILKMAFRQPTTTLNDDMIKAANNINAHVPILIDSTTRFDGVNALSGKVFQYNYTLLTMDRTEVDTNVLKTSARESMIQEMKQRGDMAIFKDNNIEIQSRYKDKNGADVSTVSIYPNEY